MAQGVGVEIDTEVISSAIEQQTSTGITVILRRLADSVTLHGLREAFSALGVDGLYDLLCLYHSSYAVRYPRPPYAILNLPSHRDAEVFMRGLQRAPPEALGPLSGTVLKLTTIQGYEDTMQTFMPIVLKPGVRCSIWSTKADSMVLGGILGLRQGGPFSIESMRL